MSTARVESDSDSEEYHDTHDSEIVVNRKISRFFLKVTNGRESISFNTIWRFQGHRELVYLLDRNKIDATYLHDSPDQKAFLIQYDISKSDLEQQKLFHKFEYYSGYWEYSINDTNGTFHPCDPQEKDKFLTSKKVLAMQFDDYCDEIEKSKHNISNYTKLFGGSITLAIAAYAYNSPGICLVLSLASLIPAALLNHNVNNNKSFGKELTKLQNAGGLFASSIISEQKKITNDTHVTTPRKPYGPQ